MGVNAAQGQRVVTPWEAFWGPPVEFLQAIDLIAHGQDMRIANPPRNVEADMRRPLNRWISGKGI